VFIPHTSGLREFPKRQSHVAAVERAVCAAGHVIADMNDFPAQSYRDYIPPNAQPGLVRCYQPECGLASWIGCELVRLLLILEALRINARISLRQLIGREGVCNSYAPGIPQQIQEGLLLPRESCGLLAKSHYRRFTFPAVRTDKRIGMQDDSLEQNDHVYTGGLAEDAKVAAPSPPHTPSGPQMV